MIGRVVAQDCSSPARTRETFANYLSCMKQTLDENYGLYENEFREHSRRAALTCFAPTIEEGNRKDRCVLSANDLNQVAWDRHGPLRDCTLCRTFASGALKAFKSTPPEEQKCIRTEMSKAIVREADYCIKKQIPGFVGLPELPDIEEKSYTYRDSVITSLSNHIIILSRLSFCKERKPTRAANTNSCLRKPFPGYLSEHCKVFSKCDSLIAVGSCARTIPQSRKAMCQCINGARDELKSKISSIYNVFNDLLTGREATAIGSSNKVDICVSNVKKQMVTKANDWVSVIDSAINTCVRKPQGQNLGLDAMLNVGCRKVFADTTGTATSQMKIAFDFINNLIDALVERSGRFCGEQCIKS
uniref:DUF725 domain-containing protein n=1 Tax=Angiostrongylus cantonensis TaxID=6313 RepID=A0A158P7K4_ANGCA